ncbi:Choline transporter-like protein 4 [Orchesella cincta]|uniref:Choline transporter-like protein n=1 Tax=Orchesella cincta TaxID=48709 RepID=A0A1D2NFG3_ORCCI|nr:Choline transporter-like protein 4 [Orchesella cincta]
MFNKDANCNSNPILRIVCVEKCPDPDNGEPWSVTKAKQRGDNEETIKRVLVCKYGVDKSKFTVDQLVEPKRQLCASYILPAKTKNVSKWKWRRNPVKNVKSIIASRCIPKLANIDEFVRTEGMDKGTLQLGVDYIIQFFNAKENMEYVFEDLRASWVFILGLLVVGAIASLIWICLMRCFAGIMVWLSLLGMIVVLSFCCYFSVTRYHELKSVNDTGEFSRAANPEFFVSEEELKEQLDTYLKLQTTWLVFAIITGTLLGILLLIVLFLRSRLFIAVALIKQGARAVSDMSFTLVWPLVPWVMQVAVIGWFLLVGLYLATASEKVYNVTRNCTCNGVEFIENQRCEPERFNKTIQKCLEACQDSACAFQQFQKLQNGLWFHLYNFFGLLWLLCFVNDMGDMVLAGCFAGWYWTLNRSKNLSTFPVGSSFLRTARYHLGTLAFGSLIISIIKFIRYFLEYVDYKTRQYQDNPVAKAVMWCMKCCFWCLEKFMKFINRNAYIMVAVYGKNFCTSARDSFFLLMRNALRAFVLDKVTDFLLFMGKLVITGGVAIGSFFLFTHSIGDGVNDTIPQLNFYLIPVIIVTIGTYFIASLFFSVYDMAVDTLFLCFLEDCERNDGSAEKPYYMPKELMQVLNKKNKPPSANGKEE